MQLADFLNTHQIVRLYHSPFDRTAKTAQIVSAQNDIPCEEDARLAEWRGQVEPESSVRERMRAVFAFAAAEAPNSGPIGLVSHGGPLDLLLRELGMDLSELATYKTRFDTTNPLPPAGVWVVEQNQNASTWKFHLAFIPTVNEGQRPIA